MEIKLLNSVFLRECYGEKNLNQKSICDENFSITRLKICCDFIAYKKTF